jgi:hypothetical protein
MFLTYLMFLVALCLSTVAAFYSIIGLSAIFAGAVVPILIMGSILEVAKLTVTVWLHEYWPRVHFTMRAYLVSAVAVLMLITSMGIFGFLSKAHSDQGLVSGTVLAKIAIYDEKIKTGKDNIDVNRKALKQMDEAVDQVMGRSSDEKGADKAVQIRRGQQKERGRLLADIEAEQKKVSQLVEDRAPVAAEVRKVEAEVGPIKYIAAFIYGDNPDSNTLERAVRWVIIILVLVFDPLAVMMLLSATESLKWEREKKEANTQPKEALPLPVDPAANDIHSWPTEWVEETYHVEEPIVAPPPVEEPTIVVEEPVVKVEQIDPDYADIEQTVDESSKEAKRRWKAEDGAHRIKSTIRMYEKGLIDRLPWEDYIDVPDNNRDVLFGSAWPEKPEKGDQFIRIDYKPTKVYKYNSVRWIEVDKTVNDRYVYNTAYLDHLIDRIKLGEYNTELLTNTESAQIEAHLQRETGQ